MIADAAPDDLHAMLRERLGGRYMWHALQWYPAPFLIEQVVRGLTGPELDDKVHAVDERKCVLQEIAGVVKLDAAQFVKGIHYENCGLRIMTEPRDHWTFKR